MGNDLFRRVLVLCIVQTVLASEVRYAAFRGNTGTAEENYSVAVIKYFLQSLYLIHISYLKIIASYTYLSPV